MKSNYVYCLSKTRVLRASSWNKYMWGRIISVKNLWPCSPNNTDSRIFLKMCNLRWTFYAAVLSPVLLHQNPVSCLQLTELHVGKLCCGPAFCMTQDLSSGTAYQVYDRLVRTPPKADWAEIDVGFSALLLTRNPFICCALPPYPFLVQGGSRCLGRYLWSLSDYSCFYQHPSKYCLKTRYILLRCHFTAHHTALYCWVTQSPGPWPLKALTLP